MGATAMRTGLAALLCAFAWLQACAPRGAPGDPPAGTRAGLHPFPAASVEVHPLTRVTRESDGRVRIDAHVELFDAFGQATRDVGLLRFELYRGGGSAEDTSERQQAVWEVDLREPAASARQFDRVTRTYVAPLLDAPEWLGTAGRATLQVVFEGLDGRRLTATRRLPG